MVEIKIFNGEQNWAYLSSNDRHWIDLIYRLASKRPGECAIVFEPAKNSGYIYSRFPRQWVHILTQDTIAVPADLLNSLLKTSRSKLYDMDYEPDGGGLALERNRRQDP